MAQISIDFSASDAATQITAAGAVRTGSGGVLIEGAGYLPGRSEQIDWTSFVSTAYAASWMVEMEVNPQTIAVGAAHDTQLHQSEGGEIGIASITRSATTATVTVIEHDFISGDSIYIKGSAVAAWNAQWTLTGVTATTLVFTCAGTEADDTSSAAVAVRVWSKGIFMAYPTAGSGTELLILYRQGSGVFSLLEKSGGVQVVTGAYISSLGKGDTCLVQMCEVAGVIYVYIDGVLLITRTRTAAATTSAFQVMRIGIGAGFTPTQMGDGLVKSFTLTNERTVSANETAHKVVQFGDSFITAGSPVPYAVGSTTVAYGLPICDATLTHQLISHCYRRTGRRFNIVGHGNNGFAWADSFANSLDTQRADMLSENPTIVWCHGSVNDTQAALPGDYQSSWEAHITAIAAHSTVKRIVVSTVPPYQRVEAHNKIVDKKAILAANAIIHDLAAFNSKVWVWDEFAAVGGFGYDQQLTIGSAAGTAAPTDLHWSPRGHAFAASQRASLLLEALTGRNQTADRRFITGGVSAQPARRAMVTDLMGNSL